MNTGAASLRRRVGWASALLGLVVSLLFAGAVVLVTEDYETVLAREILRGQAEDYSLRVGSGLPAALPRTQRLSGYRGTPPARYAGYGPGIREDHEREGVHVGVFDTSAGRLYFVIDLADIEVLERHLQLWLLLITLGGVVVSGWLGNLLAGRALAPVRQLATSVDALTARPERSQLAASMPADELGRLAEAIDAYQGRLADADMLQKRFFADASHELRTPIAVVQGAAEVLRDDPELTAGASLRVARMERGAQDLADLIEAMFAVAREQPTEHEDLDFPALAAEAWSAWPSAASPVHLDVAGVGRVHVVRRESVLLLRMLARRHFMQARSIRATPAPRQDAHRPAAASAGLPADAPADRGALSELVRRTAARAGWHVRIDAGGITLEAQASALRIRLTAQRDGDEAPFTGDRRA